MIKYLSRFALKYGLIPFAYYLVRAYLSLIRIRAVNEEMTLQYLKSGKKMIVAVWHQRIIPVVGYARKFSVYAPSAMISQSRDGDIIAGVASLLNFRPVRGSSSRGGKEALADMIADLTENQVAVHALDGPRGPRGIVKPGIIVMAQLSGVPIVPVYISVNRAWVLNSWDRFIIPKPFSKVVIRWDSPIYIPKSMDNETFENTRKKVEQCLKENQIQDDQEQGWTSPLL
jgi:lysophospholipid acyltransferase (LPLAT)-like uncharacterized protein